MDQRRGVEALSLDGALRRACVLGGEHHRLMPGASWRLGHRRGNAQSCALISSIRAQPDVTNISTRWLAMPIASVRLISDSVKPMRRNRSVAASGFFHAGQQMVDLADGHRA